MAATVVLTTSAIRDQAVDWIRKAPHATIVTFKKAGRTTSQNDRMWAMLTDIARQSELNGRKLTPDQWKVVFLSALGHQQEFIQGLEGEFIPAGFRSSKLTKEQMSDLMEYISAYCAERGIKLKDAA